MRGQAFGMTLESEFQLPGAWPDGVPSSANAVDLRIVRSTRDQVANAFSGSPTYQWRGRTDKRAHLVEMGHDEDVRVLVEEEPAFHLDRERGRLLCDIPPGDVTQMRILVDSVLFTTSALRGYDLLHCGAVVVGDRALALAAETGGGKSTLIAELVASGAGFLTDDILALSREPDGVVAHAGPPVMTRPHAPAKPVGEPIASLEDEIWCSLPVATTTTRLGGVVLLSRAPGAQDHLVRGDPNPLRLLPHLLTYPQTNERARSRFELASDIAADVPIFELSADSTTPPHELADLLLSGI